MPNSDTLLALDDSRRRAMVPGHKGLQRERLADGSIRWNYVQYVGDKQSSQRLAALTPQDAEKEWAILNGGRAAGKTVIATRGDKSLAEVVALMLAQLGAKVGVTRDEDTLTKNEINCRLHVLPYFGPSKRFSKITFRDIEAFALHLQSSDYDRQLKGWTVLTVRTTLRHLYRAALREGWATTDQLALVDSDVWPSKADLKKEPNIVTVEKFAAMVESVNPLYLNPLLVLGSTGLRVSELCGLTWDDIDIEGKRLHVRAQLRRRKGQGLVLKGPKGRTGRKTNSTRDVRLLPIAIAALERQRWIEEGKGYGRDGDYVFTTSARSGAPITQDNFRPRGVQRAAEDAGLGKINPHDLRHTTASMLKKAGVPDAVAAKMLGHTIEEYLGTYVHVIDQEAEFEALDTALTGLGFGVELTVKAGA
jgi:integrase